MTDYDRVMLYRFDEAWNGEPRAPPNAIGLHYQSASDATAGKPRGEDAARAWADIQGVLDKARTFSTLDYSSDCRDEHRWFRMTVYPMLAPIEGVVVAHEDITERKLNDLELENYRRRLEALVDERTAELEKANAAAAAAHRASIEHLNAVMNLCINAAQAMDNHGVIGIRIDAASSVKDAPGEHRDGICITVADSGSGMTPEVMERIFDPFFTTKAPGEGSGLGLSVVYGIVASLGGDVKVRSSTALGSAGTQFQVFLPAVLASAAG